MSGGQRSLKAVCDHPTKTPAPLTAQFKCVDGPLTVLGSIGDVKPGGWASQASPEGLFLGERNTFPSVSQLEFAEACGDQPQWSCSIPNQGWKQWGVGMG